MGRAGGGAQNQQVARFVHVSHPLAENFAQVHFHAFGRSLGLLVQGVDDAAVSAAHFERAYLFEVAPDGGLRHAHALLQQHLHYLALAGGGLRLQQFGDGTQAFLAVHALASQQSTAFGLAACFMISPPSAMPAGLWLCAFGFRPVARRASAALPAHRRSPLRLCEPAGSAEIWHLAQPATSALW